MNPLTSNHPAMAKNRLTHRHLRLLFAIMEIGPTTFRDLAAYCGYSVHGNDHAIEKLIAAGLVLHDPGKARSIRACCRVEVIT